MARIKVTGYIEVDDLEPEHVDLEDSTGLSAEGYEEIMYGGERFSAWSVADLVDLEIELEED